MLYRVVVKPNSKKGPLVVAAPAVSPGASAPELTVYLREKPIDGAANLALIKLLAQHFDVAKSCVIIKSGATGRFKLVEILEPPADR